MLEKERDEKENDKNKLMEKIQKKQVVLRRKCLNRQRRKCMILFNVESQPCLFQKLLYFSVVGRAGNERRKNSKSTRKEQPS